jgi:nitrate/nitrite transporter NarK
MRLKLHESPVFRAIKEAGETSHNPLKETFTYPGNGRRLLVALFGIAAGLTVIWYTAMFQVLYFLQNAMKLDPITAQVLVGIGAGAGLIFFVLFGWLSDRVGRKTPIVIGYALTLILLFPIFGIMGKAANPDLAAAAARAPVVVGGQDCSYSPFAKVQTTECGKALDMLTKRGVPYSVNRELTGVIIGDFRASAGRYPTAAELDASLKAVGYNLEKTQPQGGNIAIILLGVLALSALSGATYGPVAALLSELFPARIRYSSMSIPYHIGTGYFGGFLPFVSQYIVAKTGNPYAGLWYTWVVVAMALVVTMIWLRKDDLRALDEA